MGIISYSYDACLTTWYLVPVMHEGTAEMNGKNPIDSLQT